MIKGSGVHREHEDRYFILFGDMEVVLYDDRPDSSTRGLVSKVVMSELRRGLLNIPGGIWHADRNLGQKDALMVNFPTQPYDLESPDNTGSRSRTTTSPTASRTPAEDDRARRHGPHPNQRAQLLPYAARSALRQTVTDIELGVEDDTREVVARLEAEDDRVRFFDMPKGERLGEAYRGPILQQARGGVVCYPSDDDLWLSDHVEIMTAALAEADFASATTLCYRSEDELDVLVLVLTMPFYRELLLSGHSRVPLSAGAHTMAMYRRLPYGWRTTPAGIPTDRYMWH